MADCNIATDNGSLNTDVIPILDVKQVNRRPVQLRIRIPELLVTESVCAHGEGFTLTPQYTPSSPLTLGDYVCVCKGELRDTEGVITHVEGDIATVKIAYHQHRWVNAVYNEEGHVQMTRVGADRLPLEWCLKMNTLKAKTRSPRHPTTPARTPTQRLTSDYESSTVVLRVLGASGNHSDAGFAKMSTNDHKNFQIAPEKRFTTSSTHATSREKV